MVVRVPGKPNPNSRSGAAQGKRGVRSPQKPDARGQLVGAEEIPFEAPVREVRIEGLEAKSEEELAGGRKPGTDRTAHEENGQARMRAHGRAHLRKKILRHALGGTAAKGGQPTHRTHKKSSKRHARHAELEEHLADPHHWDVEMAEMVPSIVAAMLGRPITIFDPQAQMQKDGAVHYSFDLSGRNRLQGAPLFLSRSGVDYVAGGQGGATEVEHGANSFFAAVKAAEKGGAPMRAAGIRGAAQTSAAQELRSQVLEFVRNKANRKTISRLLSRTERRLRAPASMAPEKPVSARESYGLLPQKGEWQNNLERDRMIAIVQSKIRNPKHARTRLRRIGGDQGLFKARLAKLEAIRPRTGEIKEQIDTLKTKLERMQIEATAIRQWLGNRGKVGSAAAAPKARGVLGFTPPRAPNAPAAQKGGAQRRAQGKARRTGALGVDAAVAAKKVRVNKGTRLSILARLPEVAQDRWVTSVVAQIVDAAVKQQLVPAERSREAPSLHRSANRVLTEGPELERRLEAAGLSRASAAA